MGARPHSRVPGVFAEVTRSGLLSCHIIGMVFRFVVFCLQAAADQQTLELRG